MEKEIKEGDFVMGETMEGVVHGRVEHIMWEGGILGSPEGEYSLESMPPENPATVSYTHLTLPTICSV